MANFSEPHPYGEAVAQLIDEFSKLPGIGRKSAERLANHILAVRTEDAMKLAEAIEEVKRSIRRCKNCFNLTEVELCRLCQDSQRESNVICVVEHPRDVVALEAAGVFRGQYHVLHGRIAPLEGIGPDDLTINALVKRVREQGIEEVVMATNPTVEGDGTALYLCNLLEPLGVKMTRLARGIATGSVLEFANKQMLADALRGRQNF